MKKLKGINDLLGRKAKKKSYFTSNLEAKKSSYAYEIPRKLVYIIKDAIVGPVTLLINKSFTSGYLETVVSSAIHHPNIPNAN